MNLSNLQTSNTGGTITPYTAKTLEPVTAAAPAPQVLTPSIPKDTVKVQAGGGPTEAPKQRVIEGQANFDTGKSQLGGSGEAPLNKTLDSVIASIKTLPADKQKALLSDPNFSIDIKGRASNLGSAHKYDNAALAKKRTDATAAYVKDYLKKNGIEIPDSAIKTHSSGAPGKAKAADNNDQDDRSAKVKITLPGLDPLPANSSTPSTPSGGVPVAPPPATPTPAATPQQQALADFNKQGAALNATLTKGQAAATSLVDREAAVKQAQAQLQQAEAEIPKLDPNAQPGAQALVNGQRDQVNALTTRATKERQSFDQLRQQLATDGTNLVNTTGGKDKAALRKFATDLIAKYPDPGKVGADLPPDARDSVQKATTDLRKLVNEAIAFNSDKSGMDQVDNGYLFGRPGPKFKQNANQLELLIKSDAPWTADQKKQANQALSKMAEAVKTFEDPVVKAAAQAVYDDMAQAAKAKLAG